MPPAAPLPPPPPAPRPQHAAVQQPAASRWSPPERRGSPGRPMEGRAPGSPAGVRGLGEVKQRLFQAGCPCISLLQVECLRGLPLSGRVGGPSPPPPLPPSGAGPHPPAPALCLSGGAPPSPLFLPRPPSRPPDSGPAGTGPESRGCGGEYLGAAAVHLHEHPRGRAAGAAAPEGAEQGPSRGLGEVAKVRGGCLGGPQEPGEAADYRPRRPAHGPRALAAERAPQRLV